MEITLESLIKRKDGLLSSPIDDELVMMSIEKGKYYGLDEISRRIWELFEVNRSVASICEQLIEEHDVDESTCYKEVLAYIKELVDEGLVEIINK